MAGQEARMVKDAVINVRSNDEPWIELDGQPFPFLTDKAFGVQVEVNDANVHIVKVAIQVDRSVTVVDHSAAPDDDGC